jgi:signal transduction histidine kinase
MCTGERPSLTISNTGPVIPPGQIPRLLQPFQRLPTTRSADSEGLGLGLPIVAAIAKAHHATFTINPGQRGGLDISVSFPPATQTTPARQAARTTAWHTPSARPTDYVPHQNG